LVYNRCFRQIAATCPTTQWVQRDGDLWFIAFGSSQHGPYCLHCFGSAHRSEQCCGAPEATSREKLSYGPSEATFRANLVPIACPTCNLRPQKPKICWQWNLTHCTHLGCQYIHAVWSAMEIHTWVTIAISILTIQEAETNRVGLQYAL